MESEVKESIDAEQPNAKIHYCKLILANEDEWKRHLEDVMKNKGEKSTEDLLEEALRFDFKYDLIEI